MEIGFARLLHADWSIAPSKRWVAEATRSAGGWVVAKPRLVGPVSDFLNDLTNGPQPALAGFDFPIGLPAAYGAKTRFKGFIEALASFGFGEWSRFYEVSDHADEVSMYRPFYPRVSSSSARRAHLLSAFGADSIEILMRQCERATSGRAAACSLFWTLGAKQVGKAAISGWREIVQPARRSGALLWPFDGELSLLAQAQKLVICETYPAEAYGHVAVKFRRGGSKQKQADRREAAAMLEARCGHFSIQLTKPMRDALADGFGCEKGGDDPFDAALGLFGMIEVVEGRRAANPDGIQGAEWEGWILGQAA